MKAVRNFDQNKKVRLISFGIYWIKSEIHDYIIKNFKIVKITKTKNQKRLFFRLKQIKKIGLLNKKEKNIISNLLNVSKKDIDYIELIMNKKDLSIDNDNILSKFQHRTLSFHSKNDPLNIIERQNWIKYINKNFKDVYKSLDERSRKIMFYRWINKKKYTLKELGRMYNISSERVRQLEKNVLEKLKIKLNTENKTA